MHSSEVTDRPAPKRGWLYLLVGAIAAFELVVLGLALSPQVDAGYRAYYIDKITTCLDRDVPGDVPLGETVSFLPDGAGTARRIRVCGWSGPAGDGTHSVGDTSRLRIVFDGSPGPLAGQIVLDAIDRAEAPIQRVVISANGVKVAEATVPAGGRATLDFTIPETILGDRAVLDLDFAYPDAVLPTPLTSETYRRAIKLQSLRLARGA